MIKKFENYKDRETIDNNSIIEFKYPNGDEYIHTLQFVLPYHENILIKKGVMKTFKGSAYEVKTGEKFKFDKFESDFGGFGAVAYHRGLVKRSISGSAIVYDGKLYRNDEYELYTYWNKSKREEKPLYVLKYVTTKNGIKRYSEEGLKKVKDMYPELVYKKI